MKRIRAWLRRRVFGLRLEPATYWTPDEGFWSQECRRDTGRRHHRSTFGDYCSHCFKTPEALRRLEREAWLAPLAART